MDLKKMVVRTKAVPIYDAEGIKLHEIILPEEIVPSGHRRGGWSDNKIYYKGAGVIYHGHYANEVDKDMMLVARNNVSYQANSVIYPNLFQKYGIFTFPHQPIFSDYEGACGPKESKLPKMQREFEYSAIDEVVSVIDTPLEGHKIYAYRLKELTGGAKDTIRFLEYILQEDFNSAWDKNIWADMVAFGYLRDLADWFKSKERKHKIGTIYAILKSMMNADEYLYETVVRELTGLEQLTFIYQPYLAAIIVRRFCPECIGEWDLDNFTPSLYNHILQELYSGKACCHLENEQKWDFVKKEYMEDIPKQMKILEQELQSRGIPDFQTL